MGPRLTAHGLRSGVPAGWDVRIECRAESAVMAPGEANPMGGFVHPTLHAASSPLPADRGDYGSGYVEQMGPRNVFVCLAEFDHEAGDTAMFADGIPRQLSASDFHPDAQQRVIAGQCGSQRFFAVDGRAFCLYVVLGSWVQRALQVQQVNQFLQTIDVVDR